MLRQILHDMYVDPDILAELPEEQKAMLFFKMRQEQIRRYYDRENTLQPPTEKYKKRIKSAVKTVRILEDAHGQPWTWVFGECEGEITAEEKWRKLHDKQIDDAIRSIVLEEQEETVRKTTASNKRPCITSVTTGKTPDENTNQDINRFKQKTVRFSPTPSPTTSPEVTPVPPRRTTFNQSQMATSTTAVRKVEVNGTSRSISGTTRVDLSTNKQYSSPSGARKLIEITDGGDKIHTSQSKTKRISFSDTTTIAPPSERRNRLSHYDIVEFSTSLKEDVLSNEEWQNQLRRFKEADAERSSAARRASLEYRRQSLLAKQPKMKFRDKIRRKISKLGPGSDKKLSNVENPLFSLPQQPASKLKQAPSRHDLADTPGCVEDIIRWFVDTQRQVLYDESFITVPGWFHGIISRHEAEELLKNRSKGDFLIRVSDKIFGYTLSYKDINRIKHFLIDASEQQCYRFFGNDQMNHDSLKELLEYHKIEKLSFNGEKLRNWVGQIDSRKPDYAQLVNNDLTMQL